MTLTEHQIEVAARKLCELRGWNVHEMIGEAKMHITYTFHTADYKAITHALEQEKPECP